MLQIAVSRSPRINSKNRNGAAHSDAEDVAASGEGSPSASGSDERSTLELSGEEDEKSEHSELEALESRPRALQAMFDDEVSSFAHALTLEPPYRWYSCAISSVYPVLGCALG